MKKMFQDPIAPKPDPADKRQVQNPFKPQPGYETKKKMWSGGDNYGVGFTAPIGKLRSEGKRKSPVPQKNLRIDPRSLA
jgi:hypothetical protein